MNEKTVHSISYGLYVLTAGEDGKENGCIINTLQQVTSSPMQISITVNKANYTHDMIKNTGIFNVSIIDSTADFELFKHFGFQSGRTAPKFGTPESYKFKPNYSNNGLIYIKESTNSFISGKVIKELDLGTHTMFIAEMTDGEILSDNPSLTYAQYFASVKPKPEKPKKKGWVCKICGYIYEGEELPSDFICPVCKHGAEDFEPID